MEKCNTLDSVFAVAYPGLYEKTEAHGRYKFSFVNRDGITEWEEELDNVVTTVGKNLALDTFLAGSTYSATGPFLGLISSVSFSAVAAADTMASHAGWLEAGSGVNYPLLTARLTTNAGWAAAAAGAKSLTTARAFTIGATGGTVQGAFLVYGTGAVSTIGSTAGTLYSASAFSVPQAVSAGGTLNVSYTASL